jgi:hypothetical protein
MRLTADEAIEYFNDYIFDNRARSRYVRQTAPWIPFIVYGLDKLGCEFDRTTKRACCVSACLGIKRGTWQLTITVFMASASPRTRAPVRWCARSSALATQGHFTTIRRRRVRSTSGSRHKKGMGGHGTGIEAGQACESLTPTQ